MTYSTNKTRPAYYLLTSLLLLSGCITKLDKLPDSPKISVPEHYEAAQKGTAKDTKSNATGDSDPNSPITNAVSSKPVVSGWLDSFNDPDLNQHVQKALENNPDLWSSAAQLKKSIEQVTVTGSSLWPSLNLGTNASEVEQTEDPQDKPKSTTETRSIGGTLDVSWEADVWGKLSQRKKAAALGAKAQTELYKAAELSLVANVSRAWFNLITNKLQLDLAQKRLDSFQRSADLIEENYERGLRSALDVYLSRTDVQIQISALSDSKFNYIQSLRAFKTLLGDYPDTGLAFNAKLPDLNSDVPVGLPAKLLTRRPDIRASQLQYEAQIANAKAANRDRYPSIRFSGSIGETRNEINNLFKTDSMIERLIVNVTAPIFSAGALKSREEQAYNDAEIAYATLVKTSLNAFEEVENTLSRETVLKEQHTAIKEAVRLAESGLNLALDRYQSGIENYATVLQSQRNLFNSMQNEINIRNALLQNRIGIHLALGGSFAPDGQTRDLPSPVKQSAEKTPITEEAENESPANEKSDQSDEE